MPAKDRGAPPITSHEYLWRRLDLLADRVAAVVAPSSAESEVGDADAVHRGDLEDRADRFESEGGRLALRDIERSFGLRSEEVDLLLLAVGAEIHPRIRDLCVEDPTASGTVRPSLSLALDLVDLPADHRGVATVFDEDGPLIRHHLVSLDQHNLPLLSRRLVVPDRVARACAGLRGVDVAIRGLEAPLLPVAFDEAPRVARAVEAGARLVYVRSALEGTGLAFAAAVFAELGVAGRAFDLRRMGAEQTPYGVAASIAREGGLLDVAVALGPIDPLVDRDLECLAPLARTPWPVFLTGTRAWDPTWTQVVPYLVDAPRPGAEALRSIFADHVADHDLRMDDEAVALVSRLRLSPEGTLRAAVAARMLADAAGATEVTAEHVRVGARSQSAGRLESLAERIEPHVTFDDLVLAPLHLDQVRQVAERGRHRDRVLDEWGMGGPGSRGRGITALFAGDSGTGKTLSAEAIAGELGVDLYVIDLSTVVDKYIGETEKNLGRVFDEAEGINGVLFFDEADAIFGKRTETSDARDRYANVEVAYLLQRMERFDGVAILATNLRANIDEAFTRRLDIIVHFTLPDVDHRRLLWERHLPTTLPQAGDLDLDFLATRFEIAGGVIRNVALTGAYRAAQRGAALTMGDLVRAMSAEYSKMGRLFDTSVLGDHASALEDQLLS